MYNESTARKTNDTGRDLFSDILNIKVRNEDMINEADQAYCMEQQDKLHRTLKQIEHWYSLFKEDAEKNPPQPIDYERNYVQYEFRPHKQLSELEKNYHRAIEQFAGNLIRYFNENYHLSVPIPQIEEKTLKIGERPTYSTYINEVFGHLNGRTFQEAAEEELIEQIHKLVKPSKWTPVRVELKKDCFVFKNIIFWDSFVLDYRNEYSLSYDIISKLALLCKGIAFGTKGYINCGTGIILGFDRQNVRLSEWYNLFIQDGLKIRFYKNGRIDVKFKDAAAAENCFRSLKLDSLKDEQ